MQRGFAAGSCFAPKVVGNDTGLRFRVEELFLDSKSGVFQLEDSKIRYAKALERLYLIVALALLLATCHGMTLQLKGLRTQVDPHWKRGLSYLKIGLRWLIPVLKSNWRLRIKEKTSQNL